VPLDGRNPTNQSERQARLARLIRQPTTDVVPVDRVDATNIGRLLATSGTANIIDAHVVVCARRSAQQAVTTDSDGLRRLDPHLASRPPVPKVPRC
jgi:hypothetical protein